MIIGLLDEASADRKLDVAANEPRSSRDPSAFNRMASSALGENTEEILTEMLGYTWDDVVELKNEGVTL